MELSIHPKAKESFEEQAERFLPLMENRSRAKRIATEHHQFHVDHEITKEQIIGDIIMHDRDESGQELSKYLVEDRYSFGLFDNNFKNFVRLCESIYKIKEINCYISLETIKTTLFDWILRTFRKQTEKKAIDFLFEEIGPEIKNIQLYVPIHGLVVKDFRLGKVNFIKISKEKIDNWGEYFSKDKTYKNETEFKDYLLRLRRDMQGYSVASFAIEAESKRAQEIAIEETEKTLSILRFFSKANILPDFVSYCTLLGKENVESVRTLIVENGLLRYDIYKKISNERGWVISDEDLLMMKEMGLDELDLLLLENSPTQFQTKLLDSLIIYTKSSTIKNMSDKLMYILVSIESLLLRNHAEDIMQNVGDRIAFLIADKPNERILITDNIKKIYRLRSKFIHHGIFIDKLDAFSEFLENTFKFFTQLIKNNKYFKDQDHLLNFIENRKYS